MLSTASVPVRRGMVSAAATSMQIAPRRHKHYKLLVVGGGTGGLSVASSLSKKLPPGQIGLIEPSPIHYYQPLWTLVGGGQKKMEESMRDMMGLMPEGVEWVRDAAADFKPDENLVVTAGGAKHTYEYLLVAVGMKLQWDKIKGLPEALGKDGVTSNYSAKHAPLTWQMIQEFKGGNAIFTQPNVPIKCAGAPQKIMYIFEDRMRRAGLRDKTKVTFMQGMPAIFAIKKYADALSGLCAERGITVKTSSVLKEVKGASKEAVFQQGDKEVTVKYDFLHVTPPMAAPDCVAKSPLATGPFGYVDVDKATLQHNKYKNVFSIGDCANIPTSKTAAAVADESGVVKANIWAAMHGRSLPKKYDGYASCPLVTGVDSLILAEFNTFTGQPRETFFFNQATPRKSMYFLKANVMPDLYWEGLLSGAWEGPGQVRKVLNPGDW